MAVLRDILKESWDYYQDLKKQLEKRLKELPKGSILKRHISHNDYYYLKVREGNDVASRYLGKEAPAGLEKSIKERRLIRRQLKEVQENIHMLSKLRSRKI